MKRKIFSILVLFLLTVPLQAGEKRNRDKLWRADDPRTANPINKFHAGNPLNPANRFRHDSDFNPANEFRFDNPLNPANKFQFDNLLNPARRFDIDSPLNPINKFRSADDPPRRERKKPLDLFKDFDLWKDDRSDSFDFDLDLDLDP